MILMQFKIEIDATIFSAFMYTKHLHLEMSKSINWKVRIHIIMEESI